MSALVERILVLAGTGSLMIACLAMVVRRRSLPPVAHWNAMLALIVAGLFAAALTARWIRESQGPFLTMYEVLLSNLFSLSLVFGLVVWRQPSLKAGGIFVMPFLALLGVWLLALPTVAVPLPATFSNGWLWAHVLSGKLFLSLTFVATGVAVSLLVGRTRAAAVPERIERDVAALDTGLWQLLSVAFVFQCVMLLTGAVWAHDAWGHYWAWDPLETSAFVTWLAMGAALHARFTFPALPRWSGWLMVSGVFTLAFLTFFGVPFLSATPHSGLI